MGEALLNGESEGVLGLDGSARGMIMEIRIIGREAQRKLLLEFPFIGVYLGLTVPTLFGQDRIVYWPSSERRSVGSA